MSIDLIPKKRNIDSFRISGIGWPMLLNKTRMGYVIGYGCGVEPLECSYTPQANHGSPISNDGYVVTNLEAKAMSLVLDGYMKEQKFLQTEWNKMTINKRLYKEHCKNCRGEPLYNQPVKWEEDTFNFLEELSVFMYNSGGFKIR